MVLRFTCDDEVVTVELAKLMVAGWTGRDQAAVQHHIEELAEIGVPRPSATPLFYEVSPSLAVQSETITVLGDETSGEAEPFLLRAGGRLHLGLASDHTDRGLEAQSVAHAKQICSKPVAAELWRFDPLEARLDRLRLRMWILEGETRTLYQDGSLQDILPLERLLHQSPIAESEAMLCGTLPAIGGVRPAAFCEMELIDPDNDRAIRLAYRVKSLAVIR